MCARYYPLLILALFSVVSFAQVPDFDLPLTVTDGTSTITLHFGVDPLATDGIDTLLGEHPLSPLPPAGVFDARFNLPVNNESSLKDYRQGLAGSVFRKLHEVKYQVGAGATITFSWNLPAGISDTLKDNITGTIVNVPMAGTGSYTLTNPGVINKLHIVAHYPSAPPPWVFPPVLAYPVNNATAISISPVLKWYKTYEAYSYRVQVSTTATFSNLICNDSTLTDTVKTLSGLMYNTRYFWRVSVKNTAGTFYSNMFTFTTLGSTLPVELTSFSASYANFAVQLQWKTVSEKNCREFVVEKLIDSNWMPIAALPGNGTSTAVHTYNYVDKDIKTGKIFYRLRQTDYDGTAHYSCSIDVLAIPRVTSFELLQNYPNPFNPSTKITYALPAESKVVVEIYSVTGEKVVTLTDAFMSAGYHSLIFDARNLNTGIYIVRMKVQSLKQSLIKTQKMLLIK